MKIDDWRCEIDAIDTKLVRLLNLRTELALKVGQFKSSAGLALRVPAREKAILKRLKGLNPGPLDNDSLEKIYHVIFDLSVRSQELYGMAKAGERSRESGARGAAQPAEAGPRMNVEPNARVAFQGERGAFSEEAALKLLGDKIMLVPRLTFEAAFRAIFEGLADYILAPIENSLAGSVHRSFDLLVDSGLNIIAEEIIPIAHNLIGPPGARFDEVRVVESHPVALAQCEQFFIEHPRLKRIATEDTAGSVRSVVLAGDRDARGHRGAGARRKSTAARSCASIWRTTARTTRASGCFRLRPRNRRTRTSCLCFFSSITGPGRCCTRSNRSRAAIST